MNDVCTTFIASVRQGDSAHLNSSEVIHDMMQAIITAAHCTQIDQLTHRFTPQGVSAIALLAESHLAVHTWPEHKSAYVTLTTCSQTTPALAHVLTDIIAAALGAAQVEIKEVTA